MDKECNKCGVKKKFSEFYVNLALAGGHNYACKDCEKAYQLEYKRKRRLDPEFKKEERKRDAKRWREKYKK